MQPEIIKSKIFTYFNFITKPCSQVVNSFKVIPQIENIEHVNMAL